MASNVAVVVRLSCIVGMSGELLSKTDGQVWVLTRWRIVAVGCRLPEIVALLASFCVSHSCGSPREMSTDLPIEL
jgi:hypothetical protein